MPEPNTGCFIWLVGTSNGYSSYKNSYGHIEVWERKHGPVPKGYEIHHKCENKLCVNLAHLEALAKGLHRETHFRDKTACKYGHDIKFRTYRDAPYKRQGTYYCKECARLKAEKNRR